MATKKKEAVTVSITAPKMQQAIFEIEGNAPLIVHRFSKKVKDGLRDNQEAGKTAASRKKRDPKDSDETFNESRYISPEGWDGFNAGSIRAAMISACRLVNFKMTLAKLSIFVVQDGWDATEPQVPLIRIYGDAKRQDDVARVDNNNPYITIRAAYYKWSAKVRIRWDADQFTITDIYNLLYRVGLQVGIGEGRPDSKKSVGMGWGTFDVKEGHIIEGAL